MLLLQARTQRPTQPNPTPAPPRACVRKSKAPDSPPSTAQPATAPAKRLPTTTRHAAASGGGAALASAAEAMRNSGIARDAVGSAVLFSMERGWGVFCVCWGVPDGDWRSGALTMSWRRWAAVLAAAAFGARTESAQSPDCASRGAVQRASAMRHRILHEPYVLYAAIGREWAPGGSYSRSSIALDPRRDQPIAISNLSIFSHPAAAATRRC